MQNLILLFAKYGTAIVFVILEFLCFYLIINYNQSQREIWFHSANVFTGNVNKQTDRLNSFVDLKKQNDSLHLENAKLHQTIINYRIFDKQNTFQTFEQDSIQEEAYQLIPVTICDKTIHLRNNYLTLCNGKQDSLHRGMGIMSEDGIVGIINNVTDNFAQVLQILHSQSRVSGAIKGNDYHGNLIWSDTSPEILSLESIPKHAEISKGDTIITSGYSTAFPYGIPIGTIDNFYIAGAENTYKIDVKLFNSISNLSHAYAIKYDFFEEKQSLESDTDYE